MRGWWRSHSVRVQLTLWYVAAMTLVLAVYAAAILAYVSRSASQLLTQQLRSDFQWATVMVEQTPEGGITWNGEEAIEEHPWLQVWGADGKLLFRNGVALGQPDVGLDLPNLPDDAVVSVPTSDGVPLRVLSRKGEIAGSPVVIQVGRSEQTMREQIQTVALILLLGLPVAVVTAGLGGYMLARRALAPIERMTERAETITAERLSDRLPVSNPDNEMGRLATVFNATLARLQESFEQMRRFTADVSHELRTPLTAIRSVGEVGLRGRRNEAGYRTIIGSMLEEVDRLAGLVDRLLTLSRAETGVTTRSIEPVALKELAESVVADLAVLAEEKSQQVVIDAHGSPRGLGDRLMVRQALINLVDNAIKFAPAGTAIVIRVVESGGDATVDVIDRGSGIPTAAREHIFDRFFRASSAPADVAGTGLGLSIAKSAVETSGGALTLEQSDEHGSTFRIRLPRG
ncbi:MAG TPA: ATP-binding protein [Vicinamibacterales bacterium]|nr:ATP-binding protein [Vicinamibacterales bacterium]